MKNSLKRAASLIALGAVAASACSLNAFAAGNFSPDGGYTADQIAASEVKPVLTATKKVITLEEAKESQTIEISVANADAKYASTGIHVYYDKGLEIEMDRFGDPVASLGDAGGKLTTKVPNIDPTAADFGMEGIFVTTAGDKNYGLDGVLIKLNVKIENPVEGAVYPIDIIYRSNETNEDLFINKEADEAGKLMQAYAWTQGIFNKETNNNFVADAADIEKCADLADIAKDMDGYIAIAGGTTTTTTTTTTSTTTTTTTTTDAPTTTTTTTTTATDDTTTSTTTTTSTSTTTTTTTKTESTTTTTKSGNGAPATGVAGAGVAVAGLAVALGTAFVLRKKED